MRRKSEIGSGSLRSLEDRRRAEASECDRLAQQIYAMVDEWETLVRRQRRLERQFVEDDLRAESGPRRGQPLTRTGRQRRLQALLMIHERTRALERSLHWVEQRRARLLKKLYDRG
ncbi:MAG: hypothetical protein ACE5FG_01825 [Myxococcota bacterium]